MEGEEGRDRWREKRGGTGGGRRGEGWVEGEEGRGR